MGDMCVAIKYILSILALGSVCMAMLLCIRDILYKHMLLCIMDTFYRAMLLCIALGTHFIGNCNRSMLLCIRDTFYRSI